MNEQDEFLVNGLSLPPLLSGLMQQNRWKHPGDQRMREIIPFLEDAVDFLDVDAMRRETRVVGRGIKNDLMHQALGSKSEKPVELPWLDMEKAIFIAVNREIGGDVAIALDYRTSIDNPRVVASDWQGRDGQHWREVTPTFSEFVDLLGSKPDVE